MTVVQDITDKKRMDDEIPSSPRPRRSLDRSTPLTITNAWQGIPFRAVNSPFYVNTFSHEAYSTSKSAIIPNMAISSDQQYKVEMDFIFKHTARPLHFQLRYRVPAPTPIYFPFPQHSGPYVDLLYVKKVFTGGLLGNLLKVLNLSLAVVNSLMESRLSAPARTVYSSLGIKGYGVIPEIRISEGYTGTQRPTPTDAVLFVYPVTG